MGNYLEVTGRGVAAQAPDRLDLHVSLTAVRDSVAEALGQVNQRVAAVSVAVRERGVTDADLQTTSSSVSEEYGGPENRRTGYRATQDLRIRITDPDRVSEVLEAAIAAAGDDFRMNHLSWAVADESALAAAAREAAFDDARTKAEQLAALAGRPLGDLRRVVESDGFGGGVPRLALAKADSAGFAPERGLSQVEVSLNIRWSLE